MDNGVSGDLMTYMKPLWRLLFGLFILSVSGCGLSDYESRMDAQRARVQKFDDANNRLGDPIAMPMIQVKGGAAQPAWPFDIFLRLPKGYNFSKTYGKDWPFYRSCWPAVLEYEHLYRRGGLD